MAISTAPVIRVLFDQGLLVDLGKADHTPRFGLFRYDRLRLRLYRWLLYLVCVSIAGSSTWLVLRGYDRLWVCLYLWLLYPNLPV